MHTYTSSIHLHFVHEDQVYHCSVLLFGMSLSPLIFSKLMDVIAAFLRQRAISVFPYLDDWLIQNLIRSRLITQTSFCIQTIQSLGFLPNLKKSDLFPAQKFTFIGMEFLTQQNLVRVPTDRVQNLILTIKKIMSAKQVSARTFLSLLGKLSAAADLVLLGRLHLCPLQMCLLSVWKPHILPLDHPISINGMIRSHLQWWINPIRFETGTSIHPPDPKFFLYTDASHYGWGAHLELTTLSFHGRWTENQSQLHINMLEMMAIRLALKQAKTFIHHSCIMISTDNTTVVSYINKQGGTLSPNLCVEVWKILNWCLEQDVVIRVRGCELSTTTRVKTAWKKFKDLLPVLSSRHLSFKTRGYVYSSCVRSAMLHTSETWPLTKPNLQRLQRNDRAMIRQICNVRPQDIVTTRSSDLLVRLGIEDLDLILKERRLRWYGHVERSSGAIKTAFDIQVDGKRGPGRPKMTWKQLTERDCREWKLLAINPHDRRTWRSGVRSAMRAASQLSGRGPTDVDVAPVPAR